MAQNGRQNGQQAGGRKQPPQNPYARGHTGGSRVPGMDAFDDVKRRPPPNTPGYQAGAQQRQQAGTGGQRAPQGKRPVQQGKKGGAKQGGGQKPNSKGKKQAGPKKKKRKKRPLTQAQRRRRNRTAAVLAIVVFIGLGIWLSINVLFKIDAITVEGDSPYTAEQIVAAFGREPGDNMFGFDAKNAQRSLERGMPYLENVRIQRKLPSTIVIHVTQATETYCIETEDGYAVLSEGMKVLRIEPAPTEGLVRLYGLSSMAAAPGTKLAINADSAKAEQAQSAERAEQQAQTAAQPEPDPDPADEPPEPDEGEDPGGAEGDDPEANPEGEGEGGEADTPPPEPEPERTYEPDVSRMWESTPAERFETMQALITALEAAGFEDITWISTADMYDLQFRWQGRITVKLGAKSDLEAKLTYVFVVLTDPAQDGIGEGERGTLDASSYATTAQAHFVTD